MAEPSSPETPESAGLFQGPVDVIFPMPDQIASRVEDSSQRSRKRHWHEISIPQGDESRKKEKFHHALNDGADEIFPDHPAHEDIPMPDAPRYNFLSDYLGFDDSALLSTTKSVPIADEPTHSVERISDGKDQNKEEIDAHGPQAKLDLPSALSRLSDSPSPADNDDLMLGIEYAGRDVDDRESQAISPKAVQTLVPSSELSSVPSSWADHDDLIPSIEYDKEKTVHIVPLRIPAGTTIVTRDMFRKGYKHVDKRATRKCMVEKSRLDVIDCIQLYENIWKTYLNISPRMKALNVHHRTALHVSCEEHQWRLRYDPVDPSSKSVPGPGRNVEANTELAVLPHECSEDAREREQILVHKVHSLLQKVIGSSGSLEQPLRGDDWDRIIKSISNACASLNSRLLSILANIAGCSIVIWPAAFDFLVSTSCASVWRSEGDVEMDTHEAHLDDYLQTWNLDHLSPTKQKAFWKTEKPADRKFREELLDCIDNSKEHLGTCRRIQEALESVTKDIIADGNRASSPPTTTECHFRYDGRVVRTHKVNPKGKLLSVSLKLNGKEIGPIHKVEPGPYRLCWGGERVKSGSELGDFPGQPLVVAKTLPSSRRNGQVKSALNAVLEDTVASVEESDREGSVPVDMDRGRSKANSSSDQSYAESDDGYDTYGDPESD